MVHPDPSVAPWAAVAAANIFGDVKAVGVVPVGAGMLVAAAAVVACIVWERRRGTYAKRGCATKSLVFSVAYSLFWMGLSFTLMPIWQPAALVCMLIALPGGIVWAFSMLFAVLGFLLGLLR